jgi:hypothetical protein
MGYASKTNAYAPLILINGETFKFQTPDGGYWYDTDTHGNKQYTVNNPAIGYAESSEQLVQSTRNAKGQVVAQVINRRLNKLDSLTWPYLSCKSVSWLKKQIAKFTVYLSYWDSEEEQWITRQYYWGDFSATPCEWETVEMGKTGQYYKKPIWYKDVKCNLIDMGY